VNLALQVGGVSDETVKYGYGFRATRTIERLHCKLQTCPLVREVAPQKQDRVGVDVEEVTLRLTVGQSVSLSWCRAHFGTCDLILFHFGRLLSESFGLHTN
jgi:hypothetical protein